MSDRLKIADAEGYLIEACCNYSEIDLAKERLRNNPDADVIFIGVSDTYDRQQCVALSIKQTRKLIEYLQSLVKVFEE